MSRRPGPKSPQRDSADRSAGAGGATATSPPADNSATDRPMTEVEAARDEESVMAGSIVGGNLEGDVEPNGGGPIDQRAHCSTPTGTSWPQTGRQGGLSRLGDRLASPFFQHRRQTVTLLSLIVLALLFYLALGQLNFSGATS